MNEKPKRGRGRPPKPVAKSIDEALTIAAVGGLPYRPRNEHERMVMAKAMGRPRLSDTSPTRQAALWVQQLVTQDGMTLAGASRKAADAYGLKYETLRKYARALVAGPMVELSSTTTVMGVRVPQRKKATLLAEVEDVIPPRGGR